MSNSIPYNLKKYAKYLTMAENDPFNAQIYNQKLVHYKTMLQRGGVKDDAFSENGMMVKSSIEKLISRYNNTNGQMGGDDTSAGNRDGALIDGLFETQRRNASAVLDNLMRQKDRRSANVIADNGRLDGLRDRIDGIDTRLDAFATQSEQERNAFREQQRTYAEEQRRRDEAMQALQGVNTDHAAKLTNFGDRIGVLEKAFITTNEIVKEAKDNMEKLLQLIQQDSQLIGFMSNNAEYGSVSDADIEMLGRLGQPPPAAAAASAPPAPSSSSSSSEPPTQPVIDS